MDHGVASNVALTIALAAASGIVSQSLARSLNLPGIVVLLVVGVVLGPDVAGWIVPGSLGPALQQIVSFAVAVILFEGGMNLKVDRFRHRGTAIRRLITEGALITLVGGTLAAKLALGWTWRSAVLFGALVIVTGPTVVTPLVRRFRLVKSVATILEAEGLLIDAVGAVVAVVALEIALEPTGLGVARGIGAIALRIGFGAVAGLVGGGLLWALLRYRGLVAEGLENVFTLALVWALFHLANAILPESGIAAVTVAGMVIGNRRIPARRGLLEFNDQLTVMLIGMLFVLLAANVRVSDVLELGDMAWVTVAMLVLVVRPLAVWVSTRHCGLPVNQRLFVAWIGPRGIIAAAVASLFAERLAAAGLPGGERLKAMVFLVIAVTVALAGFTGGLVARLLRVRCAPRGWVVLGANDLGCLLARELREADQEVVLIDSSEDRCRRGAELGFESIQGDGLSEDTLHQAGIETRAGVVGITGNDALNALFVSRAKDAGNVPQKLAAIRIRTHAATHDLLHSSRGELLFCMDHDVSLWSERLRTGRAVVERRVARRKVDAAVHAGDDELWLALAHRRKGQVRPTSRDLDARPGDEVTFVLDGEHADRARDQLVQQGWELVATIEW